MSEPEDGIKVHVQLNHTCSHGHSDSSSGDNTTPTTRWETYHHVDCESADAVVDLEDLQDTPEEKECVSWPRLSHE